jgi:hypothetical protein
MRWPEHVARIWDRRIAYSILARKPVRKPRLNGRIILKSFVKKGDKEWDWIAVAQ